MRRSFALFVVAVALTSFMTTAGALVPIGVTYEDHARARASEGAGLVASPGRDLVIASYTLEAGEDDGWADYGGPAVLAVTSGTLVLQSATDAARREYTAGQAAVVPVGRHKLVNIGREPLSFSGAFFDGAPYNLRAVRSSRGTFVGPDAYGHSAHAHHAGGIQVEAGRDILVASYAGGPHGTAGWMTHKPALGIITRGTLTYYEGHDGHCVKTQFSAGQAYVHGATVTHLPSNEGAEPVEAIFVYFDLPHNADPAPLAGNQTDAVDFTPLPPSDCPRLK
jgi:hypothetical protein